VENSCYTPLGTRVVWWSSTLLVYPPPYRSLGETVLSAHQEELSAHQEELSAHQDYSCHTDGILLSHRWDTLVTPVGIHRHHGGYTRAPRWVSDVHHGGYQTYTTVGMYGTPRWVGYSPGRVGGYSPGWIGGIMPVMVGLSPLW